VFLEVYPQVLGISTHKLCRRCGEMKLRDEFFRCKSRPDGLQYNCKSCCSELGKANYKGNEARYAEMHRQWYEANKDRRAEMSRAWYEANKERFAEYVKEWATANRERLQETQKAWYEANKEYARAYNKSWYEANKDRRDKRIKEWQTANPDKRRVYCHRYRARKLSAGGACTADDLAAIRAAQTDKKGCLICWRCGKPIKGAPHLDHWIPLDKGGSDGPGNKHYMHAKCNLSKGAKLPAEIGRLL
jgi:hypothetical protein